MFLFHRSPTSAIKSLFRNWLRNNSPRREKIRTVSFWLTKKGALRLVALRTLEEKN